WPQGRQARSESTAILGAACLLCALPRHFNGFPRNREPSVAFMLRCNITVMGLCTAENVWTMTKSKVSHTLGLLADGGLIRRLWLVEGDQYRDHLLRLD